jgi:hypothetical protein
LESKHPKLVFKRIIDRLKFFFYYLLLVGVGVAHAGAISGRATSTVGCLSPGDGGGGPHAPGDGGIGHLL